MTRRCLTSVKHWQIARSASGIVSMTAASREWFTVIGTICVYRASGPARPSLLFCVAIVVAVWLAFTASHEANRTFHLHCAAQAGKTVVDLREHLRRARCCGQGRRGRAVMLVVSHGVVFGY